ncbi:MFS transporter [Riemerella anatipestifer]|nr:MFS transporter [Riemerella anatipestifer]WPC14304.1 MFS transporter [Riemerella anatipestifer]WPC16492.1 MFS transporter [Riemerella anatipestifer]
MAIANAFVYLVRYGVLDWAPTYLQAVKHYDIKEVSWAYSAYEWAAIPGTILCGWLSDKIFKGKRSLITIIYMALVTVFVFIYWKNMDNKVLDGIALIAIGFLIYGPVMLIGVQALDLAPKKAAGTAAGLTGLLGYLLGTAILANITMGYLVEYFGWDSGFILLIIACLLSIIFISFTIKDEKNLNP